MRLVMLGGPGAGKSTQAKLLCEHLDIPWISTGDILLTAIATQTDLGQQVQPYVEQGELVPDAIMIKLVRQRLQQLDVVDGWLLEGYPRTASQAEELDFLLDALGKRVDGAILLEVSQDILEQRSTQQARIDDHPDVVRRRIEVLNEITLPILDYYEYRKRLLRINGNQSPVQVQQDILSGLKNQ